MFGYKYGIQEDDKNNKILNISISLAYINASICPEEDIKNELENILDYHNPCGMLINSIENIYKENY